MKKSENDQLKSCGAENFLSTRENSLLAEQQNPWSTFLALDWQPYPSGQVFGLFSVHRIGRSVFLALKRALPSGQTSESRRLSMERNCIVVTFSSWRTAIITVSLGVETAEEISGTTSRNVYGTFTNGFIKGVDKGTFFRWTHFWKIQKLEFRIHESLTHTSRSTAHITRRQWVESTLEVGWATVDENIVTVESLLCVHIFIGDFSDSAASWATEVVAFGLGSEVVQVAVTAVVLEAGAFLQIDAEF